MATFRFRGNRWQVQIRRKGHPAIVRSFLVKRDGETWARQTEAALERGDVAHIPLPTNERVTLSEIVIRYRNTVSVLKKGREVEQIVLNAFLRHPICTKWADSLTCADFASYRDERLEKVSANTLRREFSTLHHLFEVARNEWGAHPSRNPLTGLRIGKPSPSRERRLRNGEEQRLLQSASRCRNPQIAIIIQLAIETAMRRSELLSLRWTDVNIATRVLLIRNSKNGSARHIPLSLTAVALLSKQKRESDKVFPITSNAFRLTWERVRLRADLVDLHFHDLRHEAVSRLFELGLTAPEVASISGHKDGRMLFRYAHAQRDRIIRQLDMAHSQAPIASEKNVLSPASG